MSKASNYVPAGFYTLTVHLTVERAAEYIDSLKQAFGAVELMRSPSADGRLLNASDRIGDSVTMLNDLFPRIRRYSLSLRYGGTPDALSPGCRCCVVKGPIRWMQSPIANTGPVLGRPLWRSGGPVWLCLGNRDAPGGSDRSGDRGPAKETIWWKAASSSLTVDGKTGLIVFSRVANSRMLYSPNDGSSDRRP